MDLWELKGQLRQPVKRHATEDYTRDNAVPEESHFGRAQTPEPDRRQQTAKSRGPAKQVRYDLNPQLSAEEQNNSPHL
jgi:hypothetical protein